MNKKTLIGGLVGFVIGASIIPLYGWLLGAVLGALSGQLLDLSARMRELERKLTSLHNIKDREPVASRQPEPTPQLPPEPDVTSVTPTANPPQSPPRPPAATHVGYATKQTPGITDTGRRGILSQALERVRRFFLKGNPIVRVGMVVMLFGLSFLVKYAASAGLFPVHLRLAIIAIIAIALLVIGWRTRTKKNGYGLVLQGGGIGALYLTVFAAAKLYSIFPAALALGLMLLIVVLGCILAVLQNAQILALMAAAGGFLAPILTSDGSGNHVALFTFYLILNLGILGIALFKTWRWLNWLGFLFTFGISSAWGVLSYEPYFYNSIQPFLIAFFVLYLVVSILFSIKQPLQRRGMVDGSLIFGLPIVGFGLQAALLGHTDYGLAISAVTLAAIYLLLAIGLWRRYATAQRVLAESFIALGVGFATIAIPLALDADWTSAAWALEAAGLMWVGLRQQRLLPRVAGYALYVAAVGSLFINGPFETGSTPIISGDFIGFAILAFGAFGIAYVLHLYRAAATAFEVRTQWLPISAGLLWWLIAGFNEIGVHLPSNFHFAALIAYCSLSFAGILAFANRLQWQTMFRTGYSLLPISTLIILPFVLVWLIDLDTWHPSAHFGVPALLLFALVQYAFLWRQTDRGSPALQRVWHVATAWLWLLLLFWDAGYWRHRLDLNETGSLLLWFTCFTAPLLLLMSVADKARWPFTEYRSAYKAAVSMPVVVLLVLWFVAACRFAGAILYPHVPVINPLDLAQLATLVVLVYGAKKHIGGLERLEPPLRYGGLGLLVFVWINVVVLRAVHHYSFVPYDSILLWNSSTVQMALSITWTLCALLVMVSSRWLQARPVWMVGAALLALVVIKLFTKDLTGSGTLPRVVSFMGVGALMLVIGYLSPLPASRNTSRVEGATS